VSPPASTIEASRGEAAPGAAAKATQAEPLVRFMAVEKTYDGLVNVVERLDLDIAHGEFLTLLGPSGSGKTTTLMMLAGFEEPTAGEIMLAGRSLRRVPPYARDIGMVFQNYALFPHMRVRENVAFPLVQRRVLRAEMARRVEAALEMVELQAFGDRYPKQLSGGQQQRVALARALVFEPRLMLMDEPLGALDKKLREQMQIEIKRLHERLGMTVVYVTHDQGEALTMSDRIAVFHGGRIQQVDVPAAMYDAPANSFVADFIGENNRLDGTVVATAGDLCEVRLVDGTCVRALQVVASRPGEATSVSLRPEQIALGEPVPEGHSSFAASVRDLVYLGDQIRVLLAGPGGREIAVKRPVNALPPGLEPGRRLTLSFDPYRARALDAAAPDAL
jgi:putative spermidine/putrescine transport system ATP-binding protein